MPTNIPTRHVRPHNALAGLLPPPRQQPRDEPRRDPARARPTSAPASISKSVNRADFIAVTAPTTPPAFSLNKVTDLRILMSRAAKDTQLDSVDHKSSMLIAHHQNARLIRLQVQLNLHGSLCLVSARRQFCPSVRPISQPRCPSLRKVTLYATSVRPSLKNR